MTSLRRLYIATTVAFAVVGSVPVRGACREARAFIGEDNDTLRSAVQYVQGRAFFGSGEEGQDEAVARFAQSYHDIGATGHVTVTASASPEGSPRWLAPLARERAQHLVEKLAAAGIPSGHILIGVTDVDWQQLRDSVAAHPEMPGQTAVLAALSSPQAGSPRPRLLVVAGGEAWRYMYARFFPAMRYARFAVAIPKEDITAPAAPLTLTLPTPEPPTIAPMPAPAPPPQSDSKILAVRTNLLHDIIAVPNIGVEIYLGRKFSLYMDYSGAWWGNRMSATYNAGRHVWRYEGGNLEVRRYLRRESDANPFTGWHIGVYGNIASYDFQWGDTGKQGRKPSYGGGISLGYQKPIARRWNIDFSVAAGYFGGEYKTCRFRDGHNVWVDTRQRNYFGPTRAEIALVWLWGRGNVNAAYKKGGRR